MSYFFTKNIYGLANFYSWQPVYASPLSSRVRTGVNREFYTTDLIHFIDKSAINKLQYATSAKKKITICKGKR